MGAPTLAEFTTSIPAINPQVFNPHDLRALRITAWVQLSNLGIGTGVTSYLDNFINSGTSLSTVSSALIGNIPGPRLDHATTMMLVSRAGNSNTPAETLMGNSWAGKMRQCDPDQLRRMEGYMISLFLQSCGL